METPDSRVRQELLRFANMLGCGSIGCLDSTRSLLSSASLFDKYPDSSDLTLLKAHMSKGDELFGIGALDANWSDDGTEISNYWQNMRVVRAKFVLVDMLHEARHNSNDPSGSICCLDAWYTLGLTGPKRLPVGPVENLITERCEMSKKLRPRVVRGPAEIRKLQTSGRTELEADVLLRGIVDDLLNIMRLVFPRGATGGWEVLEAWLSGWIAGRRNRNILRLKGAN